MLLSSLADRMNLYEDHFHTLIDNSDKHGRSSKHETAKVERCFESMNGSEKMSSEAPSGCSSIEKKAIDSGWSLFYCRDTGSNPSGRGAPQRPPAKQAEPLTAHPKKGIRNENK